MRGDAAWLGAGVATAPSRWAEGRASGDGLGARGVVVPGRLGGDQGSSWENVGERGRSREIVGDGLGARGAVVSGRSDGRSGGRSRRSHMK